MSTTINIIGINTFEPPPGANPLGYGDGVFKSGFTNDVFIYKSGSQDRVLIPENYGYYTYSLANPSSPAALNYQDFQQTSGFEQFGDGFSLTAGFAVSADGTHALCHYRNAKGNLSLKSSGNIFTFGGCFSGGGSSGELAIQKQGSRYIGYSLSSTIATPITVADITTFITGGGSTTANSIPHETVAGTPGGANLHITGNYVIYTNGVKVIVINATTLGTSPNIVTGFIVNQYGPEVFGLPLGSFISSVTSAIHPVTGKLYIAIETYNSARNSLGIGSAQTSDGVNFTAIGTPFLAPDPWSGTNSTVAGRSMSMAVTETDIILFNWAHRTSPDIYKLISLSVSDWGIDLTPSYVNNTFASVTSIKSLVIGSSIYLYSAHTNCASSLQLSVTVSGSGSTVPTPPTNLQVVNGDQQLVLTWDTPISDGGLAISGYSIKNITTGETFSTSNTVKTKTLLQLINGTPYTIEIKATNNLGDSGPTTIVGIPTSTTTVPSTVINLNAVPGDGLVTLNWLPPSSTGGSPLLQYNVVNHTTAEIFIVSATTLTKIITGLTNTTPYTFGVYAANIVGHGPEVTVTSTPVATDTIPAAPVISNQTTADQSITINWGPPYNTGGLPILGYTLILDKVYPVGPSLSYEFTSTTLAFTATALNNGQVYQFRIKAKNSLGYGPFVFSEKLAVNSLPNTGPTTQLVTLDYNYSQFFIAPIELNRQSDNYLKYIYPETVLETLIVDDEEQTIENVTKHVPTTEYDAVNAKALVESRVFMQVRNKDISNPLLYSNGSNTNSYDIELENKFIRPNSVTVQYYDSSNNLLTFRDYLGDGILRYRLKTAVDFGDPITFSYPLDAISGTYYGTIDYRNGNIKNLIFPRIKPAILIGTGIKFPLNVTTTTVTTLTSGVTSIITSGLIYLNVNGQKKAFNLKGDTTKLYSASAIASLLNDCDDQLFKNAGLVAGVLDNQLYIQNKGLNINLGPEKTLTFNTDVGNLNSQNYKLFSLGAIQRPSSIIYISYSYTTNDPSKYHHIWYQTPHFTLVSKASPAQFVTKGHFEYLLEKLNDIRPINTVLAPITFQTTVEEEVTVSERFTVSTLTGVGMPYLTAIIPKVDPLQFRGTVQLIKVINPDNQEDQEDDIFSWL